MLHTSVVVLMALEVSSAPHFYPSQRAGMATTVAICLAYLTWVCFIAHSGGFWVYPILKVLYKSKQSLTIDVFDLRTTQPMSVSLWALHR